MGARKDRRETQRASAAARRRKVLALAGLLFALSLVWGRNLLWKPLMSFAQSARSDASTAPAQMRSVQARSRCRSTTSPR